MFALSLVLIVVGAACFLAIMEAFAEAVIRDLMPHWLFDSKRPMIYFFLLLAGAVLVGPMGVGILVDL